MDGKRLIEKIRLRNILSFGDQGEEIELEPLNIIIGQNASGKSNLVDVLKLLRALPQESGLANFINENGGFEEWIWKGEKKENYTSIEVLVNTVIKRIEYTIFFKEQLQNLEINYEAIKDLEENTYLTRRKIDFGGQIGEENSIISHFLVLKENNFARDLLRGFLLKLAVYSNLETNRKSDIRKPQIGNSTKHFLDEDGINLSQVLYDADYKYDIKKKIIENLKKFNPNIKDYSNKFLGDFMLFFILEEGLEKPISAMRLSDGTLRYLCLLAILCHPEPPPLICIEEPETGLHPDILPTIAELMKDAAQRTQLIVTTHSDILVSAFSDMPEAVLVCEKDADGTHFKRLEAEKLKTWLEEYTLGEAWLRGAIGGTRW